VIAKHETDGACGCPPWTFQRLARPAGGRSTVSLGVDLLAKAGRDYRLKKQIVHVTTASGKSRASSLRQRCTAKCIRRGGFQHFRRAHVRGVLDQRFVLFSMERLSSYGTGTGNRLLPRALTSIRAAGGPPGNSRSAFHPIERQSWYEYEFTIQSARGVLARARHGHVQEVRKDAGGWPVCTTA